MIIKIKCKDIQNEILNKIKLSTNLLDKINFAEFNLFNFIKI